MATASRIAWKLTTEAFLRHCDSRRCILWIADRVVTVEQGQSQKGYPHHALPMNGVDKKNILCQSAPAVLSPYGVVVSF